LAGVISGLSNVFFASVADGECWKCIACPGVWFVCYRYKLFIFHPVALWNLPVKAAIFETSAGNALLFPGFFVLLSPNPRR
jgi:hypothetical protein